MTPILIACNNMSTDNLQSRPSSISNSRETNTFLRENYLESHSRKIAAIMNNEWTKKIFASCEYKDGKINQNIPNEPQVTDSGLAKQHLKSGYEHVWNYYQQGIADSLAISNEIELTIESFEKKVFEEIDKDIETSHGKRKLDRKTKDEFFIKEGGFNTVPQEFDFSLYLYPEVLSEIFQEIDNRNNIKEKRTLWIKSLGTYTYLVIGNPDSQRYMQKDLAFGDVRYIEGYRLG